jgi:hypothetical protein
VRGKRLECIAYLQNNLVGAEWCFDQINSGWDTMIRAFEMAGGSAAVHFEDDAVLCDWFSEKLEAAITERPNTIIQFFSMRPEDLTVGSRWDDQFMNCQCFYVPAGLNGPLAEYMRSADPVNDKRIAKCKDPSDWAIRQWMRDRRMRYWIHVPNLVDHAVTVSLINPKRARARQSLTFQQAYAPSQLQ